VTDWVHRPPKGQPQKNFVAGQHSPRPAAQWPAGVTTGIDQCVCGGMCGGTKAAPRSRSMGRWRGPDAAAGRVAGGGSPVPLKECAVRS